MGSEYYKIYKGKRLGPYSYDRPIHRFTPKDVARIAKTVSERDGHTALEVCAAVLVALGFGASICTVAKSTRAALSLTAFLKKLAISLSVGQVVKVVIQMLLKSKLKAPPALNILLAITIAALVLIDSIVDAVPTLIANRDDMMSVTGFLDDLCRHVKQLSDDAMESVDDTGFFDAIAATVNDAAMKFKSPVDQAWDLLIDETWWDRFLEIFK